MATQTLDQLQSKLQAYRASKQAASAPAPTTAPTAPPSTANLAPSGIDPTRYAALKSSLSSYNAGTASPDTSSIPKDGGNPLVDFAKGIFSAPATLVARPLQAVAELAGASSEDVDKFSSKYSGGLVAPVPQNYGDVKKDVGRAAETIALGTGAPIAGGALFGAGSSLEQGNDLLSAQTAFNTVLGGAGGKVLDLIGKPLLNGVGKVVGTITPTVLKDVAAKGTGAIQQFAKDHQLLGGAAAPLSEKIAGGLQKTDEAIGQGFKKGGQAVKDVAAQQFPDLSPTKHYTAVNERDIRQPTTINKSAYAKATDIFNKAKNEGIDLDKVATEQGVYHHDIDGGKSYNTADTVEQLRDRVYSAGGEKARPAIKLASYETPRVPNEQIHGALRKRIQDLPDTTADAEEKETMIKAIDNRYGADSAAARAHPNGYDLTQLHDNRIRAGKNGHYIDGVSDAPTTAKAKLSRIEEGVFRDTFDRSAPKELKIDDFRHESHKILSLANYLEKLHGKAIPEGVTKKAVKLFGRGLGGVIGSKVGGFPGFLVGSRGGDMLFSTFEAFPNPIKTKILNSIQLDDPESFKAIVDYIGKKEAEKLLQKALPAAGESSFKEPGKTLFATPGGTITPNKGEAIDLTAVEKGNTKAPKTDRRLRSYLSKVNAAQNNERYTPTRDLPTIKTGRVPKKKTLNETFIR